MPRSGRRRPSRRRACGGRAARAGRPAAGGRRGRRPATPRQDPRAAREDGADVVGVGDPREPGRAEQVGGDPLGRDERQHRPLGRQVLEELAREHAQPEPAGPRDQEQQRVSALHGGERLVVGQKAVDAKSRAQPERLGPLPIGRAKPAHEARLDHLAQLRPVGQEPGERLEERPRAPHAEEEPGVEDPQAVRRRVLEAGELVEVAAVRDHRARRAGRGQRPRLVGDRLGHGRERRDAREGAPRHRLEHGPLGADAAPVVAPVRVGEPRVAQVGDPRHAGPAGHDVPDHVGRRRRRRGEDDARPSARGRSAPPPAPHPAPRRRADRGPGAGGRRGRPGWPRPAGPRRPPARRRPGARPRGRGSGRGGRPSRRGSRPQGRGRARPTSGRRVRARRRPSRTPAGACRA